jgi:hypothetical protein
MHTWFVSNRMFLGCVLFGVVFPGAERGFVAQVDRQLFKEIDIRIESTAWLPVLFLKSKQLLP